MTNEAKEKLKELTEGIDFAMLVTRTPEGELRSRPMSTQQMDSEGFLWFISDRDSAKVHEIEECSRINIAYSHPGKNVYVSISGRVTIVEDRSKIKELWEPSHKIWFPDGPDDPSICLIRVEVTTAEYWDSRSNKIVLLFQAAKALLKNEPFRPQIGHEKLVG